MTWARRGTRALGTAALWTGWFFTPPLWAGPNLWDVARDPSSARADAVLRRAERARVSIESEYSGRELQQKLNQRSALLIEMAAGEKFDDVRLLFLYGECLVHAGDYAQAKGRRVLRRVLEQAPQGPLAARAWQSVATASSLLGDYPAEWGAYAHALQLEPGPEARAVIYLKRGASNMALGRLDQAIADYETAAYETQVAETRALAQWGLAVALDRQLDFPRARVWAQEAGRGRFGPAGSQLAIDLEEVTFSPEFERHYYRGLLLVAQAYELQGQEAYIAALQTAKLVWINYLHEAPRSGPWVARAKQHSAWIDTELGKVLPD